MKVFFVSIMLALISFSSFAEVVKAYDCKMIDRSNMKRMTVSFAQTEDSANNEYNVTILFTKADDIIVNRILNGKTSLTKSDSYVNVTLDKDPYNGKVGNYFWSFRFPADFLKGSIPADFGMEKVQKAAYKWGGTPSGQGNYSGIGFEYDWMCRSLND